MSKYDGEMNAAGKVPKALDDLLRGQVGPRTTRRDRDKAMAHFLSGEEGWLDARKTLRGAFAKPSREETRLRGGSDK